MKVLLLAGGSGTRLFPLSRKKYPKQFVKLFGGKSLFSLTIERALSLVRKDDILIVANPLLQPLIEKELSEFGGGFEVAYEPLPKDTAPAIAFGVKELMKAGTEESEPILVMPSDHFIKDNRAFKSSVENGMDAARSGYIVMFGIPPTFPHTGYGYIEFRYEKIGNDVYKVVRFHEKPDLETAKSYISSKRFFWNSGIFLFTSKTLKEEFRKHAGEFLKFLEGELELEELPSISIDYALMEKTKRTAVVKAGFDWSDVGSWSSVYNLLKSPDSSLFTVGNVKTFDTKDSIIMGNDRYVITLGVKDLVIVETPDVVLVANKNKSEEIKEVVKSLSSDRSTRYIVEEAPVVYRKWGNYVELERGKGYRVKRLVVEPGKSMSLQLHYHRSEHWVVVRGTAKVEFEDEKGELKTKIIHENESFFVPKAKKHRLENPGKIPLEVIEVQVGEYVEEDDIIRFNEKEKKGKEDEKNIP